MSAITCDHGDLLSTLRPTSWMGEFGPQGHEIWELYEGPQTVGLQAVFRFRGAQLPIAIC
jgi:hypothetical protein